MSIEEIRDFQKKTQVDLKIFKNNFRVIIRPNIPINYDSILFNLTDIKYFSLNIIT